MTLTRPRDASEQIITHAARRFANSIFPANSPFDSAGWVCEPYAQGGVFVDWQHVVRRLRDAQAYWLATVTPTGRPHVVPIWGVVVRDDLFLETGARETMKTRNLEVNRRVVVHLDDVNDVVIVRGEAIDVRPAVALGQELAAAFSAKSPDYHPKPESWRDGRLVQIKPSAIFAWHDMPTATRWRFAPP